MGIVFINYRRDSTAGEARALYNDLVQMLGSERVFMDVDNIALGRDFREVLRERLDDCEVMLALIGRGWADAKDAAGQRRLHQPDDFVRLEIVTALHRNVAVTPVLLQDARMPGAESLPEDLKALAFRNGFEINHQTWESNVQELVRRLGLATVPRPGPQPTSRTALLLGAGAVLLAGAAGAWYALQPAPAPLPVPAPAPAPAPAPIPAPAPRAAPAAPPVAEAAVIRDLVDQLTGADKTLRVAAAERLKRDFPRSHEAVAAAVAQLEWDRFRLMAGAAPRAQLITFLIGTDDAGWTAETRARAARAIGVLREQAALPENAFRPQMVANIEDLAKRLGI